MTDESAPIDGPNLPEEFWSRRPLFVTIRQHADATMTAPDAVLVRVIVRAAAMIPPTTVLPPIVGSYGTFDLIGATVGGPSAGKSASAAAARDLLPFPDHFEIITRPLGSGEGIPDKYLGPHDKNTGRRPIVRRSVHFELDEGQALTKMMNRQGSTHAETIRAAWSGQSLGSANADVERDRDLQPRSYRFTLVMNFQPSTAAPILADRVTGTPQRFLWAPATRTLALPAKLPDRPAPLAPPSPLPWTGTLDGSPRVVDLHSDIRHEIADLRREALTRPMLDETDDGHDTLLTLKVAGVIAWLTNDTTIGLAEWSDAEDIVAMSNRTRRLLTAHAQASKRQQTAARRLEIVETSLATDEARERHRIEFLNRQAHSVGRKMWRQADDVRLPPSELWKAIDGTARTRLLAELGDNAQTILLEHAAGLGLIALDPADDSQDRYRRGRVEPKSPGDLA